MKHWQLVLLTSVIALTACNTVEGMGKDFKAAGETIEETAEENKKY